jgi:hypothetical protein
MIGVGYFALKNFVLEKVIFIEIKFRESSLQSDCSKLYDSLHTAKNCKIYNLDINFLETNKKN